jgi:predicted dehydrogenase
MSQVQIESSYVLVGAGQLGTRHLQALVGHACQPLSIQVIDPVQASLDMARERAVAVENGKGNAKLNYLNNLEEIASEIDFSVIATGAHCRLAVMRQLFSHASVRYLLLEKILFQSVEQVDQAIELIRQSGTEAFVNCPRRMFPIYQELRELLKGSKRLSLVVEGSDWGLACNAIHFIDLWSYLTGSTDYELDISTLSTAILDSKRTGYKEVSGVLRGRCGDFSFQLQSTVSGSAEIQPLTVRVETEKFVIDVEESKGVCRIADLVEGTQLEKEFSILYQSQLTHLVADSLLTEGRCELTPFDESAALHKPLLSGLLAFFNEYDDVVRDHCPIT